MLTGSASSTPTNTPNITNVKEAISIMIATKICPGINRTGEIKDLFNKNINVEDTKGKDPMLSGKRNQYRDNDHPIPSGLEIPSGPVVGYSYCALCKDESWDR